MSTTKPPFISPSTPQDPSVICPAGYVPAGAARSVEIYVAGETLDLIIWNQGNETEPIYKVFQNSCPHLAMPLETFPDRFLSEDKTALVCSTHGARFDANGICFIGPCEGKSLIPVPFMINENFELVLGKKLTHS